jgi:ribonuclease HII
VSSNDALAADYEIGLLARGFRVIAGADEAGRGSLAGPLIAAAVVLNHKSLPDGLRDSKKLTPKRRSEIFEHITSECRAWSVGIIEAAEIDRLGIQKANMNALESAVLNLKERPDYVVADWYKNDGFQLPWEGVRDGDSLVASIAAASIVAKVTRDHLMLELALKYPGYGFERHKGYGSAEHLAAISELGPSPVHRLSYRPCSALKLL